MEGKAWAGPYCGFHGRGQGRAGQAGLGLASLNHFRRLEVEVLSLVTWDLVLGMIRAEDYYLLDSESQMEVVHSTGIRIGWFV